MKKKKLTKKVTNRSFIIEKIGNHVYIENENTIIKLNNIDISNITIKK